MKKILFMASVVLVLVLTVNYYAQQEGKVYSIKLDSDVVDHKTAKEIAKTTQEIQVVVSSKDIPSLEQLESEFIRKSDEELKAAIEMNNSWADKKQFVAKANTNNLSKQDSAEFLRYMRLNSALHKILLERQLEAFEQETL